MKLPASKNTVESIRRISALIIALSLALPQRSCVNGGQVEIHYPLSNADSALAIIVIAVLYTFPLLVLLLRRYQATSLLAGIATVGAGLYYLSYGSTIFATTLLAGWYTYTFGAIAYLGASLIQFKQVLVPSNSLKVDHLHGPPL